MTTQTTTRRRVALWAACALAAAACVTGVAMPARAYNKTPVPIASATPTAPAAGSMLAGKTIDIRIELKEYLRATATSKENMHQLHMEFDAHYPDKVTAEECQQIADTFWSGTGPEFKPNATYAYESCELDAFYSGQSRHAFYSLDESGHFQLRAPMEYLTQVAASFDNASIVQLEVNARHIRNAQCNASPSSQDVDAPLLAGTHTTTCWWRTSDGAAIPTTDEPLIEGDIEDFFYTYDLGTNGPFVDMTLPINPFTPSTPTASEDATPDAASAAASGDRSEPGRSSSTGLLIGIGAAITTLLLVATAALVVALRRRH